MTTAPTTLSAAASRFVARTTRGKGNTPDQGWQNRAWDMYHAVPEVRFAASWIGNAMTGALLYAARRADDGTIERAPDNHRANEIVSQIAGGPDGQAKMLAAFGKHLTVPGEGWIIVRPNAEVLSPDAPEDGHDWRVLSVREVRRQAGKLIAVVDGDEVEVPEGDPENVDPDAPVAIRVWESDPERAIEADSPVRSSLDLLEELQLLNAAVKAIARSRLTGRGILLVPKGTRFPTPNVQAGAQDDLIEILMTVAETAIRDPESAAATVPIVLEVPAESISDFKLLTFESDFDELALKLREEAVRRFAIGMEIPAEFMLGLGEVNHWCTLPTVQIMTQRGWKSHTELLTGELVLTLNHETGLSEWQPLQAVNTWEVTDEPMVRIKGKRHSSLTTAGHRWPVLNGRADSERSRDWTTSRDLFQDRHGPDARKHHNEYVLLAAPHAELPAEPKYADALVELVAWLFTEGRVAERDGRNTAQVSIYQSHTVNPDNCARIERALTTLFGPASDQLDKGGRYASAESVKRRAEARRLRDENPKLSYKTIGEQLGVSAQMVMKYLREDAKTRDDVPRWRKVLRKGGTMTLYRLNAAASAVLAEHAPGRIVNLDFIRSLTQSQLELFIDTAVRGDGWHIGNTPVLTQKDPEMLDAFELAAVLSGRSTLRRSHTSMGAGADGPREKTQNLLSVSDTTMFAPQPRHVSEEPYTGTVWCPTTPNGTWLARDEDGSVFYTGNSAWALTEEAIRLGIEPKLATIAYALTQQWLRPLLQAEGVEDWHRWMVWYDSSPLRVRANKSETALQVYDRGVISDEALRRETGFDDADAPDEAEQARRDEEADDEEQLAEPELPVDETTSPPDTQQDEPEADDLPASTWPDHSALWAAADGLIWAALSAAGEKLKRTPACPRSERSRAREIEAAALHTVLPVDVDGVEKWHLLDGAWTRVPEIADRYGLRPDCLTATLDAYARELIAAGIDHDFAVVPGVLLPCMAAAA
ncbi:hypothetical protein ACH5AL_15145 [Actinacidiphila glaucinigra]|uniref:hypothetical protein n=1 Tax=Actinacidiphila glaucinigra TaxID=235986 RepID=UPI0037974A09